MIYFVFLPILSLWIVCPCWANHFTFLCTVLKARANLIYVRLSLSGIIIDYLRCVPRINQIRHIQWVLRSWVLETSWYLWCSSKLRPMSPCKCTVPHWIQPLYFHFHAFHIMIENPISFSQLLICPSKIS